MVDSTLSKNTHHLLETSSRHNVARMDKTVKVPSRLFDLLPHIIVAFYIKHVGDKVQGMLIVLHFGIERCQVEAVREVFFVNVTEILVATGVDKLNVFTVSPRQISMSQYAWKSYSVSEPEARQPQFTSFSKT